MIIISANGIGGEITLSIFFFFFIFGIWTWVEEFVEWAYKNIKKQP